jgi:hypothetical protein
MDFHQIWYGRYAIGGCTKLVHSPVFTWWILKVVGWDDDDAKIHDALHMRITPLMTSAPVISDYMHSIIKE